MQKRKLDLCTTIFFFFAVKCTEISMRVIVPLWEVGVGVIKLQNKSFVLFAFLEIRWPGRIDWCLLCWRSVCWGFYWPLKRDILALCTSVVTLFSSRRMCLRPCCLVCDILYKYPVFLVLVTYWAFSCSTRNKNKNENNGISSSLFLVLQHVWDMLLRQVKDLG